MASDTAFFIHDGDDPVVFIGDSITEQRMYTALIESYVLTRHPDWRVRFRNVGWSGDTVWMQQRGGLEHGWARDIQPLQPKAALIEYGMNDARGEDSTKDLFRQNLALLVGKLQAAGARVAVLSPSPEERYDPGQPAGSQYNATLQAFAAIAAQAAAERKADYVDQLDPILGAISAGRADGVLGEHGEPRLIPDGIHPNWSGHLLMATAILRGLGARALVSRVAIDAATRTVTEQDHCACSIATAPLPEGGVIAITRADRALPWPIPTACALALQLPGPSPVEALSRYELAVAHLPSGRYRIAIDDDPVCEATAEQLAQGINLSQRCGVIQAQAQRVLELVMAKNDLYFERWRSVQLWSAPPWLGGLDTEGKRTQELARLDAAIGQAEQSIDAARVPVPHTFLISNAPPPPPSPLALTAQGADTVVSWHAVRGAVGYRIERAAPNQPFMQVAEVGGAAERWVDSGAAHELVYRVRALSALSPSDPTLARSLSWGTDGWCASYYTGEDLSGPALNRRETRLDFDWGRLPPAATIPREHFSARFTAVVTPPASGRYVITATADDGVRVLLDGAPVVDAWRQQGPTACVGTVELSQGKPHEVVVEYFQAAGGAVLAVAWQGPGLTPQLMQGPCIAPAIRTDPQAGALAPLVAPAVDAVPPANLPAP